MATLAAIILMLPPATACDDPRPDSAEGRCEALFAEFSAAYQAWYDATRRAATPGGAGPPPRPDGAAYARKFLAIASERPDDPVAPLALAWAVVVDPFGEPWGEAVATLAERHARSPAIGDALGTIALDMTRPDVEPFLRRVLADNPSARVRAAYALANRLLRLARAAEDHPERPGRDGDEPALRAEAERLLELLASGYADVPFDERRGIAFGGHARTALRAVRSLVVGGRAPEITGVDAEGRPLKLSDHRGKVVVLTWWASWCGPCLAMIPHERELAARSRGKPFAMLGVNGDEDAGRMRQQIEEHGVSWPSWADGGPRGPISTSWNV